MTAGGQSKEGHTRTESTISTPKTSLSHEHLAIFKLVISAALAAFTVVQGIFDGGITAADTGLAAGESYKFNDNERNVEIG